MLGGVYDRRFITGQLLENISVRCKGIAIKNISNMAWLRKDPRTYFL
jgi:hypothetical protein